MLQAIREKTSGWIAYLIIGLISIPFALWGINSYLGGGAEQPAAIVNGDEITPRQLDAAYARYREQLATIFGGRIPAALNDENALKEQALTQLIEQRVLENYVRDKGFRLGDSELFAIIQSMQVFQQEGKFSKEQYQQQLASQGYNPAFFEQELRRQTEMQQLNKAIKASAFTIPAEVKKLNQLENEERKLRVLTFKNLSDTVTVNDQEIKDFYDNNSARFMQPEEVKIDFIELSLDKIAQNISISDDMLQEKYNEMREHLTTPETRHASHILLTVEDENESDAVREKLLQLKKKIENGEDFAAVAKSESQDPGSATEGGDLGEVEKGMMVPPFENALFSMQVNEISEPVKTQFGWHLIKLHSIQGGDTKSFEDARDEIEKELKTELAENQIYDLAENLASIAYEEPTSLEPAAEQLDLKVETTDWFSRAQGEGIASEEKVREAAFSDEVLNQKINSELIELADNRVVIIHLNEHQPAAQKPLSEVRQQIINELKKQKGRKLAQEQGKKALNALKSGEKSMQAIADEENTELQDVGYVKRKDGKLSSELLSAAFVLPKPEHNQPIYEGVSRLNGNYSILELSEVRVGQSSEDKGAEEQLRKTLNGAKANAEYQALIKELTDQAEIIRTPVTELQ